MNPAVLPMGMFGLAQQRRPAPEPFVFGRGGKRMSVDDIELKRRIAAQEMADAGSGAPVQHWLQGLNRSLGAVTGGLRMRGANRADEQRKAEAKATTDAEIAALLANSGDKETILRAMATGGEGVQSVAKLLAEPMFAKPGAPPEVIQLSQLANDPNQPEYVRRDAADAIRARNDRQVTVTLPGGGIFVGPQSELAAVLQGGGGQASGAGQTTQPPAAAIEDLRANPATAAQFDEVFGAGAAARVLGNGGAGASRVGSNFLVGI